MMQCCKNKTTPFCDKCGSDLEAKSLAGLKKHLEGRLETAKNRLVKWIDELHRALGDDEAKAARGIDRSTNTIVQLESWIAEIAKANKEAIG